MPRAGSKIVVVRLANAAPNPLVTQLGALGHTISEMDLVAAVGMASTGQADLIVLDVTELDATKLKACEAIKGSDKDTLLLALSDQPEVIERLDAKCHPDLVLPVWTESAELLVRIEQMLGGTDPTGQQDEADPIGFAELLVDLWQKNTTGTLTVEGEGIRTTIYLLEGTPVFAEHGTVGDALGRILLRLGKITEEQLSQAVQIMTDSLVSNEQIRLGEVLVQMGALGGEAIYDALTVQTRDKLLNCFQWQKLACDLDPNPDFLEEIERFPCPVPPLLYDGIRSHYSLRRLETLLEQYRDKTPKFKGPADRVAKVFTLDTACRRRLELIDGVRTVGELIEASDAPLPMYQLLSALIMGRAVTVMDEPEPAAAQSPASATEPPTTQAPAAKPATAEAKSSILDDAVISRGRAEARQRLMHRSENLRQVLQARRSNPPQDAKPADPKRAKMEAEAASQKGRRLRRQAAPEIALTEFERAAHLAPDVVEYEMMVAFMRFVLTSAKHEDHDKLRDLAFNLAKKALSQDRRLASAYNVMGHIRKLDGEHKAALKAFENAAELDRHDVESESEARLLRRRLKSK